MPDAVNLTGARGRLVAIGDRVVGGVQECREPLRILSVEGVTFNEYLFDQVAFDQSFIEAELTLESSAESTATCLLSTASTIKTDLVRIEGSPARGGFLRRH